MGKVYSGVDDTSGSEDADKTPHADDGADGQQPPCSADVERCVDTFWGFPLFVLVEGKCVTEEHGRPDCKHELCEQIVKPEEFKNVHRQNRSWRTSRRVVRWLAGAQHLGLGCPCCVVDSNCADFGTMRTRMAPVIEIKNLTKFYGDVRGVENIDITVNQGEIFGFLGPNGAGKSTAIRVLLDMLRPTSGTAAVFGLDSQADSIEIHRRIGYLPGELAMYDRMTARQMLGYFASISGLDSLSEMHALADRFQLDLDRPFRSYSSGNRQKVGLVHAFMASPELVILDEPTTSLDPLMQQEFYRLLDELKEEGRTVFLSSHVLPEVERVADRVAIIRAGHIVAIERIVDLKAQARRVIEVTFESPVPMNEFDGLGSVADIAALPDGRSLSFTVVGSMDELVKALARHPVRNMVSANGNLEDVFLEFYSEAGGRDAK